MDLIRTSAVPVRCARPEDLQAILAVEQAAFPAEDRFPRRSWARLISRPTALSMVIPCPTEFLAPDVPTCIATIAWLLRCTSSLGRMYSLSVHPVARGRGLARQLIASSLRRLPGRIDTLGLEVRSDNAAAVGLYCALGFVESARLPDYYGPGRSGLRMRAARAEVEQVLNARG